MGKKKYFCDFCQRSFNDDPKTRASHVASSLHLMLRELHYRQFKDALTILNEESTKKPCYQFQQDGFCRFSSNCKYSHLLPEEMEDLKRQANQAALPPAVNLLNAEEWYNNSKKGLAADKTKLQSYEVPVDVADLPPSLAPFDVVEYLQADLPEWGD